MKNSIIAAIIVILLVILGFSFFGEKSGDESHNESNGAMMESEKHMHDDDDHDHDHDDAMEHDDDDSMMKDDDVMMEESHMDDTVKEGDAMMQKEDDGAMEDGSGAMVDVEVEVETEASVDTEPVTSAVREFVVGGTNFAFDVTEMRVSKGDTVRVVFTSNGGFHDWVVDEFNAATKQLKAGESDTIEFIASESGTFEYYCSVGSHRALGMVGNLIVE